MTTISSHLYQGDTHAQEDRPRHRHRPGPQLPHRHVPQQDRDQLIKNQALIQRPHRWIRVCFFVKMGAKTNPQEPTLERRTHMTNRLMKRIIAAAIVIVISEKLRTWAKK